MVLRDVLGALPYFETLDQESLRFLAEAAIYQAYDADEMIFLEGETARGMWIVQKGRVKIFKLNPEGEEHILHFLGENSTFNDIAAFDGGANPASAMALSDVGVWLIPSETLNTLFDRNPQLSRRIIKMLAARVRNLVGQIEDLALYSVTIRLARFLLKQIEDPALSGPGVTRAAIAAHLATKPETVSRSLRTLEEAGAIRFDRHRIVIVDERLMRTLAAL
jgi:CRP/FNR family transcriptional regulator, dissimilatory nitrate respiration regulator